MKQFIHEHSKAIIITIIIAILIAIAIILGLRISDNTENTVDEFNELTGGNQAMVIDEDGTPQFFASFVEALEEGNGEVVLAGDLRLKLGKTIEIADGKNVTLNLNGHKIIAEPKDSGVHTFIVNEGNLTINDSIGGGYIQWTDTNPCQMVNGNYSYASDVITNHGHLTINGGRFISNTAGAACYCVDNVNNGTVYGDVTLTVNGGSFYNYYTNAIRMFCNSVDCYNKVTINGGTVEGYGSVWLQQPNNRANKASLTINGGTFKTTEKAVVNGTTALLDSNSYMQILVGWKTSYNGTNTTVALNGGEFYESVCIFNSHTYPGHITIRGGTYHGWFAVYDEESDLPLIMGGRYADDYIVENNVAPGFKAVKENGYWKIVEDAN